MLSSKRLKALLVASVFIYMLLVALGNILDPGINFAYVSHVLAMDSVFPDNSQRWRAISSPWLWKLAYAAIVAYEVILALWLARASYLLLKVDDAVGWTNALSIASTALVATMLLWMVPFITVGGEWFQMWQSTTWNGVEVATRNFTVHGLILLYLQTPD